MTLRMFPKSKTAATSWCNKKPGGFISMTINQNLFAMIALSLATSTASMAQTFQPEIVGGTQVSDQSKVPFLIQLHDQNGVECGGTVIAPTWILSAGHCEEVVSGITIYAGSLVSGKGTILKVKNHFVDPDFKETNSGVSHDFMLIQLASPITDSKIKPIALADADFESRGLQDPGQMMTVAGWGDLKENGGSYPTNAYSVQVPIVDEKVANATNAYNGILDDTTLAAGYAKGGKDSCDGDSGGPLFTYDTAKKQNVLVGVVSFGDGCAEANKYGIYAKVTAGLAWINQTMSANSDSSSDPTSPAKPPKKPKKPKQPKK
jgi:secreted trypsin-like serine protease